jgi:DNA-binding CsgD family transcriptional regulator
LASVLADSPDRSVWHLAASRIGPDDEVATALDAAATRALHRGANAVAAEALARAAHFTAQPEKRGVLLVRAAQRTFELGRPDRGLHLLHQAESLNLAPREHTLLLWYKEIYGSARGQGWSDATRLRAFAELADQSLAEGDIDLALSFLTQSVLRCYWGNPDPQTRERFLATAERIPVPDDHPSLVAVHALVAPIERGATVIDRLTRMSSRDLDDDPGMTYRLSLAASAVGDFVSSARLATLSIEGLRLQARLGMVSQLLLTQAFTTFYLGSWDVAMPAAAEADRLAHETGQDLWGTVARLVAAMVAAVRGEHALAGALTADAERELVPLGANRFLSLVQHARGLIALAGGRYAAAFVHLHRMFVPTESAYHSVVRCWAIADLVEAAVHSDHQDEAREMVAEMEALAAEARFPFLRVSLTYVRPLLAEDADAAQLFQEALAADLIHWPFLRGRLQLAYGSWLRRQRRASESRDPLRAAREVFDALGALAWGERARQELRASGETSRSRVPEAREHLSPQELQIAQMAAAGLSNREIGRRLFVSHRTVGSHLYHLFPKLGITSRAELRSALGTMASGEEPPIR